MIALVKALRRQRPALKTLLKEAGVPVDEAEELLLAVVREIPAEQWERMPPPKIDDELLRRVRGACARFAAVKRPPAPAVFKVPRAKPRTRRKA